MFHNKMNLNDKLSHHIPLQDAASQNTDVFGVEVELEGKGILAAPAIVKKYWAQHADQSLRQLKPGDESIEYVSQKPLRFLDMEEAIQVLFDFLNSPGVEVYESYRTSIHVHVNFGVETFRTIYNFMTLSMILDELLVSQNGDHRVGNNFCLRAKDARGQVVGLINSIQATNNFFNITANDRYSSINFASLLKFGSIEFRSLECTTHAGRVMHWIGTLSRMKMISRSFKNPMDVIQQFSSLGPAAFLNLVLGPYAVKYAAISGANEMLRDGMRIAQDFAYCSAWEESSPK